MTIRDWKVKKSKNYENEDMLNAVNQINKQMLHLWVDWEGFWNVYYSNYPYNKDIKVYRGKSKEKAKIQFNKWLKNY